MAKSSKSHPTDSDAGVRTSESGVGRLRGFASKPSPPLSLSALRPLFRHRNQVGPRHAGKSARVHRYLFYTAAAGGTINPHSRSTRKKRVRAAARPPRGGAKAPILRARCSAADRTLPRRTTCGDFWYFWLQKYMKKLFLFSLLFGGEKQQKPPDRFRCRHPDVRKRRRATARVCKQTVSAAHAFSLPATFPPSEPNRGSALRGKK